MTLCFYRSHQSIVNKIIIDLNILKQCITPSARKLNYRQIYVNTICVLNEYISWMFWKDLQKQILHKDNEDNCKLNIIFLKIRKSVQIPATIKAKRKTQAFMSGFDSMTDDFIKNTIIYSIPEMMQFLVISRSIIHIWPLSLIQNKTVTPFHMYMNVTIKF